MIILILLINYILTEIDNDIEGDILLKGLDLKKKT
jgi:hypothetical protein